MSSPSLALLGGLDPDSDDDLSDSLPLPSLPSASSVSAEISAAFGGLALSPGAAAAGSGRLLDQLLSLERPLVTREMVPFLALDSVAQELCKRVLSPRGGPEERVGESYKAALLMSCAQGAPAPPVLAWTGEACRVLVGELWKAFGEGGEAHLWHV
jgi:hypothetical protein